MQLNTEGLIPQRPSQLLGTGGIIVSFPRCTVMGIHSETCCGFLVCMWTCLCMWI